MLEVGGLIEQACEGQRVGVIRCSANATQTTKGCGCNHGVRGRYAGKLPLSLDMSALKSEAGYM